MQLLNLSQLNDNISEDQFFLIDKKVYDLYAKQLSALEGKVVMVLDNPEGHKNFTSFETVSNFFLDQNILRNQKLVVIGGGALSDLGGFVASSLLRGIGWKVVPTTLLSLIDASIGGKTGINTQYGKNLIGSFHKPEAILPSLDFLKTLEQADYNSGLGELIKYHFLSQSIKRSSLEKTILNCMKYKDEIVTQDLFDKGLRESFNFGHTFGHGIESMTNLSHGESVLCGIFINLSLFSPELLELFHELIAYYDIELPSIKLETDKILNFMQRDKKNTLRGRISFSVIKSIGVFQKVEYSSDQLKEKIGGNENCKNFFF